MPAIVSVHSSPDMVGAWDCFMRRENKERDVSHPKTLLYCNGQVSPLQQLPAITIEIHNYTLTIYDSTYESRNCFMVIATVCEKIGA